METDNKTPSERLAFQIISEWVDKGSKVLDLGCGDGALLSLLIDEKKS